MARKKVITLTVPALSKAELERLQQVPDDALFYELKRRRVEKAEALDGEIGYLRKTIQEVEDQLTVLKVKRRELEAQKSQFTRAI